MEENRTLEDISREKYPRTDKGKEITSGPNTGKAGHNYWPIYEQYFNAYRGNITNFLEFGFGAHGDCLRTFSEYFPDAKSIVGADWNQDFVTGLQFTDNRIKRYWVNQESLETLDDLVASLKSDGIENFDIIIDDGNHSTSSITNCFRKLFPLVTPGGLYVIEDTYHLINETLEGGMNILTYLQVLANEHECENWTLSTQFPQGDMVKSVHTYRGLIFIEKGNNISK